MGYASIQNLYKDKQILAFKQVYCMEKCEGTSSHIGYRKDEDKLFFYSGGANRDTFVALFNQEDLIQRFRTLAEEHGVNRICLYGEAYGGKIQKMAESYGKDMNFIAFDANVDEKWLSVTQSEKLANQLGVEFVPYEFVDATEEALNHERDRDSIIAIRRGMGEGKKREGVVLRPPFEVTTNNGERICAKHKREDFAEHKSKRSLDVDPAVLENAEAIAEEWCVMNRLHHVIQHLTINGREPMMEDMSKIINEMVADIYREAKGEIIQSKLVERAIGTKTVKLFKQHLKDQPMSY
jgi:hypothetical protein